MIKPLFISPEYLSDDVNGKIERLFIEALDNSQYEPTVLCCKTTTREIVSVHTIQLKRNKRVSLFEKKHYKSLGLPDEYSLSWLIRCIFHVLLKRKHFVFDYVHTYSVPYSTHILGYLLKKLFNVKWVAQFYEPWSENMYLNLDKLPRYKKKVLYWEKIIARNADVIIHNSEIAKNSWITKYGTDTKVVALNLPFNPEVLKIKDDSTIFSKDDIIVTHIGNLYNLRNGREVVQGVSLLRDKYPCAFKKLKVYFIGRVQQDDKELIEELKLSNAIILLGPKTEEECIPYYLNSDAFIAIDGEGQGPLFFPSKIIKYYYFQKPILGITDYKSVLDCELNCSHHTSVRHNDPQKICDFLHDISTHNDDLYKFDKDSWKRFSVSNVVKEYENIIISNQISIRQ